VQGIDIGVSVMEPSGSGTTYPLLLRLRKDYTNISWVPPAIPRAMSQKWKINVN
jgi:hypothetical protein